MHVHVMVAQMFVAYSEKMTVLIFLSRARVRVGLRVSVT